MPSWDDLVNDYLSHPDADRASWLTARLTHALSEIGSSRGGRNVILYASAFLQRPQVPASKIQISAEDLNGFMACVYQMQCDKGLTLVLHTPGGATNATETIVAYIRSKFDDFEVVIPAYAMSAGTMISLATNRLVMGRQSQLGPIDPQMIIGQRAASAQAVVDQFQKARSDILANPMLAHVWAPILPSLGPSLLVDAQNALSYSESMVRNWLEQWMFAGDSDAASKAQKAAQHFNDAKTHLSHGRRIDRDEARSQELNVEDLEASQDLQEDVLSVYHLMTIAFEQSSVVKMMHTDVGRTWHKSHT